MIDQPTVSPAVGSLAQRYCSWTGAPQVGTSHVTAGGGQQQYGAGAPGPAAARERFRREEEALQYVAEPLLPAGAGHDLFLADHRRDGARDQVPFAAERHGYDRL